MSDVPILSPEWAEVLVGAALCAPHWSDTDVEIQCLKAIATGQTTCIETRELEALRRDAGRYRWFRSPDAKGWDLVCNKHSQALDADIDAAIAKDQT